MMKQLRTIGLALMALCALGAFAASIASAETLPEFMNALANTWTARGGEGTLFGAAPIKCTEVSGSGTTEVSGKLGTWTTDFHGCTVVILGKTLICSSLGDREGLILTGGTWHLVRGPRTDPILIWFLLNELHIECAGSGLAALVIVRGNVLGLIRAIGTTKKVFEVLVNAKGATEQETKEFINNSGTSVKAQLLSNLNGGAFSESGENAGRSTVETEKATELL
jgi:hypothetical protein